jgi:hypothetical protein
MSLNQRLYVSIKNRPDTMVANTQMYGWNSKLTAPLEAGIAVGIGEGPLMALA